MMIHNDLKSLICKSHKQLLKNTNLRAVSHLPVFISLFGNKYLSRFVEVKTRNNPPSLPPGTKCNQFEVGPFNVAYMPKFLNNSHSSSLRKWRRKRRGLGLILRDFWSYWMRRKVAIKACPVMRRVELDETR